MDRRDLKAAITQEWLRFGLAQDGDPVALFVWEEALYSRFLQRGDRILLIGCGTGRDLMALLDRGHRVEGLELVPESVTRVRQRLAERDLDAPVHLGDIETVDLSGRYDAFVFSWFCYAYIPQSAQRIRVLRRLAGCLAPGGRILISYVPADTPGPRRALRVAHALTRLRRSDWRPEPGDSIAPIGTTMTSVSFQHFFQAGEAEAEARAAGLQVLAHEACDQTMILALARPG